MGQTITEILDDLRSFVGGRGRDDNFCYSKVYSPKSWVRCTDFSRWVGLQLVKNDIFALAVFKTQLSEGSSVGTSITFNLSEDGEDVEIEDYEGDISPLPFEREVRRNELEIKHILQFPFEEYFATDIRSAKIDLLIAWLLHYSREQFAKVMMPYHLKLKKADTYLEEFASLREKQMKLPADLIIDRVFSEFQSELGKLPLATRLHFFDLLGYSGNRKQAKQKSLTEMMLDDTLSAGIDKIQSTQLLQQSKLITSSPDGKEFIAPQYIDSASVAWNYAKQIAPVYHEWINEVTFLISDQLGIYYYDNDDPSNDRYISPEEFEE